MSTEKAKFELGDIVDIQKPMFRETMRFVVSDNMPNGTDVYFSDETGQRVSSLSLGLYELIDHDDQVSANLKMIDSKIKDLVELRNKIIDERLKWVDIFD